MTAICSNRISKFIHCKQHCLSFCKNSKQLLFDLTYNEIRRQHRLSDLPCQAHIPLNNPAGSFSLELISHVKNAPRSKNPNSISLTSVLGRSYSPISFFPWKKISTIIKPDDVYFSVVFIAVNKTEQCLCFDIVVVFH